MRKLLLEWGGRNLIGNKVKYNKFFTNYIKNPFDDSDNDKIICEEGK
jgi:hypothetical protein